MASNFGNIVSRTLNQKNTSYDEVIYQQGRPPCDSEFNLSGEIASEKTAEFIRKKYTSGWLKINDFYFDNTESYSFFTDSPENQLQLQIDPTVVEINPSGSQYFSASNNIGDVSWELLRNDSESSIISSGTSLTYTAGINTGLDVLIASDSINCSSAVSIIKVKGLCNELVVESEFVNVKPSTEKIFTVTGNRGTVTWTSLKNDSGSTTVFPATGTSFTYTTGNLSGIDILIATDSEDAIPGIIVINIGNKSCDGKNEEIALVNGWVIPFRNTLIDAIRNKITLTPSPVGDYRKDLVFLEVWKMLLSAGDDTGKPNNTQLYQYGNILSGSAYINDEMIDPEANFETAKRVQIQYSVRVVEDVDFDGYPFGLGAPNVTSKGPYPLESSYKFFNQARSEENSDSGLWRATCQYIDGDDNIFSTVDGYCYAIPIAKIHRRNSSAYHEISNPNGSAFSISDTDSDRPDGLKYDEINSADVEDLRFLSDFSNLNAILNKNFSDILENKNTTAIVSDLSGQVFGNKLTQIDKITTESDGSNTNNLGTFDGTTSVFSENIFVQKLLIYETPDLVDDLTPVIVTIEKGKFPTIFTSEYYRAFSLTNLSEITDGTFEINITQDELTFTPVSSYADGVLILYSVELPANQGLTYIPNKIYDIVNYTDVLNPESYFYSFEEDEKTSFLADRSFTSTLINPEGVKYTDYYDVYPGPLNETTTEIKQKSGLIIYNYYYEVTATSRIFTLPGTIEGRKIRNITNVFASTLPSYLPISSITQIKDGSGNPSSYTVTLPIAFLIVPGTILKFEMVLEGTVVNISRTTKRIGPYFKLETLSSSSGSGGTGPFEFDSANAPTGKLCAVNHIDYTGTIGSYSPACFVETISGTYVDSKLYVEPVYNLNKLTIDTIATISSGKNIEISCLVEYVPDDTQKIKIIYSYVPIQIPQLPSEITLEIIDSTNNLFVSNQGFGSVSTGFNYENPLYQIPAPDKSYFDGDVPPSFSGDYLLSSEQPLLNFITENSNLYRLPEISGVNFIGKKITLSGLTTDIENRKYYSNIDLKFELFNYLSISSDQWHRNMFPVLVKVISDTNKIFPINLVMLCIFINNRNDNKFNISNKFENGFGAVLFNVKNSIFLKK